jgi:hypothetical protein
MATGSRALSDYPSDLIVVVCDRCNRKGRLNKAKLITEYGLDAALPDVLRLIADCTKSKGYGNDLCSAKYEGL